MIRRDDSHIYSVDFARLESALELMNTRCVDKYFNNIFQLNVLVSHKPNLSVYIPGTLLGELSLPQFGGLNFLVTLTFLDVSSKK